MPTHLSTVYQPKFGLLTDLYQLTMAYGYYRRGLHQRRSIFHLFYRKPPFGGDFALATGLPLAVDLIKGLHFSADDVQYLGRLKGADGKMLFNEQFLNFLQRLKFSGDLWGVPEGEIVLPHEPLLRIEASLLEAQLLETALLTVMNFSTLVATKAARIKAAAGEDTVLEFGLRRAQGIDGGLTASRSAYLGGCDATSNVWAGRYYQIPVKGTHAHSWVMVFPQEITAFEAYAAAMPNNCIFLVDTYDTIEGIKRAIQVGQQLRKKGHEMLGIRLDSGDLAELSIAARQLLDEAGFPKASIVASDSLDEHAIAELKAKNAKIDTWGIGTRLATAHDQPALGGVYKLAAIQNERGEWEDRIKLSENPIKRSFPGRLNVMRYEVVERGTAYALVGSQLYNEFDGAPSGTIVSKDGKVLSEQLTLPNFQGTPLLQPILQAGKQVYSFPTLSQTRLRAMQNWRYWSGRMMHNIGLEPRLLARQQSLQRQ
ncbi:MAG: nicotinate phosphoribosyltransferase [Bacteroidota bacterium]